MWQIQVSKRSYQQNLFLSEIINYTVSKTAHLVALQLSNTGLSVEFIASKLINQSPHSQFLDRALKPDAKKLNWDAHYKWVCSTHMFRRTLDFDPSNRQWQQLLEIYFQQLLSLVGTLFPVRESNMSHETMIKAYQRRAQLSTSRIF